jgi:peptide/nickel transport system substrate-binding protein
MRSLSRRTFLYRSALLAALASVSRAADEQDNDHPSISWKAPGPLEGGRVVLDPAEFPTRFQESPLLAEQVRLGRLPAVHERIGQDPLVIQPLHSIGRYGGTLHRAFIGPSDFQGAARFTSGPDSLLYFDYQWKRVVPNIARGLELSNDERTLTVFLRRGMRWSDGAPFTADDVMFWYTDMYRDARVVGAAVLNLMFDDKDVILEKVDATTVQFISPRAYPLLPEILAGYNDLSGPSLYGRLGMGGFAPLHYLSQFHPKYTSESQVSRAARAAGFVSWALFLKNRNDWSLNTELPVVAPWKLISPINSRNFALDRNPYSIWVDTDGNQLPYIDRVTHVLCSHPETVVLKAVAGALDFQDRHLDIGKLPVLLSNRRRSRYRVFLDPAAGTDVAVGINISYTEDAEIGSLLRTTAFRRALSLSIDRDAFNESLMLGLGRPSATVPLPENKYFPGEEWQRRWATYDVAQANRLLDAIGLSRRDAGGYRLRRDGGGPLRLEFQVTVGNFDTLAMGEVLREHWRAIGIDLDVRLIQSTLWMQRCMNGAIQMTHLPVGAEDPFGYPDYLFPFSMRGGSALVGPPYVRWFQSGGSEGTEPPAVFRKMMELWRRGRSAPEPERIVLGQEIIKLHVDEVISIGVLSGAYNFYGMHLAKDTLGNVPRRLINSLLVKTPLNALPMTFFYKADS